MEEEVQETTAKRGSVVADPEIKAMSQIAKILDAITDEEARSRVVEWAYNRWSTDVPPM